MTNEIDILIKLRTAIDTVGTPYITIEFPKWDTDLGFVAGKTKEHLGQAAELAGYGIKLMGDSSALLERNASFEVSIERG
jgi:hypothetical protein